MRVPESAIYHPFPLNQSSKPALNELQTSLRLYPWPSNPCLRISNTSCPGHCRCGGVFPHCLPVEALGLALFCDCGLFTKTYCIVHNQRLPIGPGAKKSKRQPQPCSPTLLISVIREMDRSNCHPHLIACLKGEGDENGLVRLKDSPL